MCGFVGFSGKQTGKHPEYNQKAVIKEMLDQIVHRALTLRKFIVMTPRCLALLD